VYVCLYIYTYIHIHGHYFHCPVHATNPSELIQRLLHTLLFSYIEALTKEGR
jgi:hypothetical protein